ncbi:MAG: hypothetical protein KME16_08625 [Scytolyngbya sp. HA4215-MV1]|jgi:hypothetical protein|nr:hypothetical protein [Scytolyngbya sp. HA4215-MV1]
MSSCDRVLVAILNNPKDMDIVRIQHWYRIPLDKGAKFFSVERPPQWLAFYQTKVFGQEAFAIHYFAQVKQVEQVPRSSLFADEATHPDRHKLYYKLELSTLQRLPRPIPSSRLRRITFILTTLERLQTATDVSELFLIAQPS